MISGKNGDKLGMVAYDRFPALLSSLFRNISEPKICAFDVLLFLFSSVKRLVSNLFFDIMTTASCMWDPVLSACRLLMSSKWCSKTNRIFALLRFVLICFL